ncbi:hypothetical protein [Chitinophaga sp. Cy-1792]|uniref:exopolysaccharide transport family protein n=1 Tax=Chitinophaga sp. Cy-1792 TaxID=2608339 RepID=UPI00141E13E4|nr:hypothetical protein [Chitinophaga sp. Cy-1792]NIG56318.1 hypothetical protein [Chitinophaga sp. Cy-1792]
MDVIYFLKALLKKKWLIIISSILAVVAAFFFTMNKPKLYVSSAQMATGLTYTDQIRLRDDHVNMFEVDQKFESLITTITSPIVISLLSYDLLLHDMGGNRNNAFRILKEAQLNNPAYKNADKQKLLMLCQQKHDSMQMLSAYRPDERELQEVLKIYGYDYESLKGQLIAARMNRTDYIDLTFRSEHPELSAYIVNKLYAEFIRYYRSQRSEQTVENVETFAALVEQKKKELDTKVEALRSYKASEKLLNVDAASGSELQQIKGFEKTLFDERSNMNTLQASLDNINNQLSMAAGGKTVYNTSANGDIISLKRQITDLNEDYVKTGSTDEALEAKIKGLRSQLQSKVEQMTVTSGKNVTNADELQQKKGSLQAQIKATNMNIANLESRIASLRGTLGSYASKEATVGSLQQEVTMAQEDYNKLKEKLNAAIDNRSAPQDGFKQSLIGQPAIKPESSKRLVVMGLSGISVFFLTTLAILFLEFIDTSLKSPSIFERSVALKLISSINQTDLRRYSILNILQKKDSGNSADKKQRQNTFRELLRKLRYEVEHSGKQIFLFTSTEAQQGKTTLTQALAYSLSLSNKKVLIIDTNFCNNDLTVQLDAKPTLETFSIPREQFSIDKIRDIVTLYPSEGVEVIGCKGGDYTPSEILPENHLLNYLPELSAYYDFILLEGAPLNDYTDSKELVNYVQGVIAVFSSHAVLKQTDKESIAFLQDLGDKCIGAVLNKVKEDYLEL